MVMSTPNKLIPRQTTAAASTGDEPGPVRVLHVLPELRSGGMERAALRLIRHSLEMNGECRADHKIVHGLCIIQADPADLRSQCPPGVPTCVLHHSSPRGLDRYRCWRKLREAIDAFRPEVVHARSTGTWFDATVAVRGRRHIRLLLSFHGRTNLNPLGWRRRLLNRWAAGRADAVLTVSREAAEMIRQDWSVWPHKLHTIPNGVDTCRFRPAEDQTERPAIRQQVGAEPAAPVAICVANLVPIKGIDLLLRAWRQVCMADSSAQLWLVGEGPLLGELQGLAGQLRITPRVRFLGARQDVPELLRAADLFVLSSRYEGCSNATLEAMAAGLPVVAPDVGGMRELVAPYRTGWLVPAGSAESLAHTMLAAFMDRSMRSRVGQAARQTAIRDFGVDAWVGKHAALYRRLARGESEPAPVMEAATCAG